MTDTNTNVQAEKATSATPVATAGASDASKVEVKAEEKKVE